MVSSDIPSGQTAREDSEHLSFLPFCEDNMSWKVALMNCFYHLSNPLRARGCDDPPHETNLLFGKADKETDEVLMSHCNENIFVFEQGALRNSYIHFFITQLSERQSRFMLLLGV